MLVDCLSEDSFDDRVAGDNDCLTYTQQEAYNIVDVFPSRGSILFCLSVRVLFTCSDRSLCKTSTSLPNEVEEMATKKARAN